MNRATRRISIGFAALLLAPLAALHAAEKSPPLVPPATIKADPAGCAVATGDLLAFGPGPTGRGGGAGGRQLRRRRCRRDSTAGRWRAAGEPGQGCGAEPGQGRNHGCAMAAERHVDEVSAAEDAGGGNLRLPRYGRRQEFEVGLVERTGPVVAAGRLGQGSIARRMAADFRPLPELREPCDRGAVPGRQTDADPEPREAGMLVAEPGVAQEPRRRRIRSLGPQRLRRRGGLAEGGDGPRGGPCVSVEAGRFRCDSVRRQSQRQFR